MNSKVKEMLSDVDSDSNTEAESVIASTVDLDDASKNERDVEIEGIDGDDEVDDRVILSEIRKGTNSIALYSVVSLCISMALLSLSYLYQFQERSKEQDYETTFSSPALLNFEDNLCQNGNSNPLFWKDLLENQIDVLQNLVHASLLGGAVIVAAIRGDAVWFYFSRNVTFFFCPVAWAYVVTDAYQVHRYGDADPYKLRITLALLMALTSSVALWKLEATRQLVWRRRCYQYDAASLSHHESNNEQESDSKGTEYRLARTIYNLTLLVQFNALAYVCITTFQWFRMQAVCEDSTGYDNGLRRLEGVMEEQAHQGSGAEGNLLPFEMAYGLGAHESFLLALLLLVATYPKDAASIGGSILCSSWRLIVAFGSLLSIFDSSVGDGTSVRIRFAFLYTTAEIVAILPILACSLLLLRRKVQLQAGSRNDGYRVIGPQQNEADTDKEGQSGMLDGKQRRELNPTKQTWENDPSTNQYPGCKEDEEMHFIKKSLTFHCPTLRRIYLSASYSNQQRKGAQLLWWGSLALISEMTAESVIQLGRSVIETNTSHEIYKWGMHICSIFSFCVVMSVETPAIYRRARWLLAIACPLGSLLALWQLSMFLETTNALADVLSRIIASLLVFRSVGGFIQCAGLLYLRDTEPVSSLYVTEVTREQEQQLNKSKHTARFVLFFLYIPAFAMYVFGFSIWGNCSEPMLSPTIPQKSCAGSGMDLMLAQNWLGLGLFFHFGMLVVMFAADGLNDDVPSYKPSLLIATFFSGHVAALIAIHFLWNLVGSNTWTQMSEADIVRCVLLFLWMTTSGYLSFCVYKHWSLRTSTPFLDR